MGAYYFDKTVIALPPEPPAFYIAEQLGATLASQTIELGPWPAKRVPKAEQLIVEAARKLRKMPEEVFVGKVRWPWVEESWTARKYAGVEFYFVMHPTFFAFS